MTTFFQPGGPQTGGPHYADTAEPQQYYPATGHPAAPAPHVDYHHPYPTYQAGPAAWSQPQQVSMPRTHQPQPYQPQTHQLQTYQLEPYQPPSWGAAVSPAPHRNKVVALCISVALLLVAGVVTVIVVLTQGDSAAPVAPHVPSPSAPVMSAPTPAGPVQPHPFPGGPVAQTTDVPTVPAQSTPDQTVPAQTVPDQTEPARPAGVPGQREAEQTAGGFVDALRSSNFTDAAGYICSAKAAAFAAGASQLSTQVQLETLEFAGVKVTGSSAVMTMTYQAVGQNQTMHESLPMTVESGSWKVCN